MQQNCSAPTRTSSEIHAVPGWRGYRSTFRSFSREELLSKNSGSTSSITYCIGTNYGSSAQGTNIPLQPCQPRLSETLTVPRSTECLYDRGEIINITTLTP